MIFSDMFISHPFRVKPRRESLFAVDRGYHFHRVSNSSFSFENFNAFLRRTDLCSSPSIISPLISTNLRARGKHIYSINTDGSDIFSRSTVNDSDKNNFRAAISLIIGTAVGPGMLGLPSATIKAGALPSSIAIILSWVYVISSILLVAELSYEAKGRGGDTEVTFTTVATNTLGSQMGFLVAIVYACLSFSLLVACVSGIGSIFLEWFPSMNPIIAYSTFPCIVGLILGVFPFSVIDGMNRLLCSVMLFSITTLVALGVYVGRRSLLCSISYASWNPSVVLPAIPITVLTLGFHVITPFICKIIGKTVFDARKAILLGGSIPLLMVLSWNTIVLGLSRTKTYTEDPIKLLLSVNPSALPAIQGFAFTALATSLIGYAISFPKQLADTLDLIRFRTHSNHLSPSSFSITERYNEGTKSESLDSRTILGAENNSSNQRNIFLMVLVLGAPVLIASFFREAFSVALDFAGIYANCFLFGVLPPIMAWLQRKKRIKLSKRSMGGRGVHLVPGGDYALFLLFGISVILGIWH